jgi:hypothetical protein
MLAMPLGAWQPAASDAIGGCLVPVVKMELGQNALHVILDRVLANDQSLGNLSVRETPDY